MSFKFLMAVVCATFLVSSQAMAEAEPATEDSIRELIRVTKADAMGDQIVSQMFERYKTMRPEIPGEFWDRLYSKFDMTELVDLMIPVYQKYLTEEEVLGLIEFNKTPLGQKMIAINPPMMAESVEIGMNWGARVGEQVVEELRAELARQAAE